MTSSTKPEAHNISQRRQRRIEPRPQATRIKTVKFGLVVFELCERIDRQTNRHTHHGTSHPPGGEVTRTSVQCNYSEITAIRLTALWFFFVFLQQDQTFSILAYFCLLYNKSTTKRINGVWALHKASHKRCFQSDYDRRTVISYA